MSKKLNILLVTYEFPPEMATGGIGSYMNHLAHLLHASSHRVTVFSATTTHSDVYIVQREHCLNYLLPASEQETFREKVLTVFEAFIAENEVDVIESPEVGACALEIKKAFPQIPLIVKMHTPGVLITKISNSYQSLFTKLRFIIGALLRRRIDFGYWSRHDKNKKSDPEYLICEKADTLLSPSQALKKWAINFWQLPENKLKVLPNPFTADEDLFAYPIERHTKTICFIGKLTILKGMFTLTPAIKKILKEFPEYKFVLAGRDEPVSDSIPSMQKWMQKQLKTIGDRVIFSGFLGREAVKKLLGSSEICVVPSLWENYPTVVLEAMAAGCTVAASKRGGIPEMIKHGGNGLLFNPENVPDIIFSIKKLIESDVLRFKIAEEARLKVRSNNSVQDLIGIYEKDLKNLQRDIITEY